MKRTTLIIALLITIAANAQTEATFSIGMKMKPASPMIAAGVDFHANNFIISPGMIVDISNSEPANFGVKVGYEYPVTEDVKLRAGAGYFYQLYSLDAYDKGKNGFAGNVYFSAAYKRWFGQVEYMNCLRLSIGVRATIFNQ